ncbi:MAG: helix-turn-helix domain-containing protein [Chloroflexota bacterium]
MARQTMSAIEAGKVAPTMAVVVRLARALGKQVDDLFRLDVEALGGYDTSVIGRS